MSSQRTIRRKIAVHTNDEHKTSVFSDVNNIFKQSNDCDSNDVCALHAVGILSMVPSINAILGNVKFDILAHFAELNVDQSDCMNDIELYNADWVARSVIGSNNEVKNESLSDELKKWPVNYNISHSTLGSLLQVLRKPC